MLSPAAFYGKSVFTTVAIYNSKPFLWQKHWLRLTKNADKIEIDLAEFSERSIKNSLYKVIAENKLTNGRARLTFFDESSVSIWQTGQISRTGFLINTADFREIPTCFRLTVSPFYVNSTSPLAGIKSGNYLENVLTLKDAKAKNFDEAVRLNERGDIVSACMANIFWLKDGKFFTPNLETGCLAGTTREFVLENYSTCEKSANLDEISESDAIFLTSAGIGIVQIGEFQTRKFKCESHEILQIFKTQIAA